MNIGNANIEHSVRKTIKRKRSLADYFMSLDKRFQIGKTEKSYPEFILKSMIK